MISSDSSSRLVVIPVMGLSKRFAATGVESPKWALPIGSRPMLAWALDTFLAMADAEIRFVVPRQSEGVFRRVVAACNIEFSVVYLDSATRGQAESVQRALSAQDAERRLWIFNCDSRIRPGALDPDLVDGNSLVCAELAGEHWSFVRVDSGSRVVEVREKQRLSNYCSTGLYSFEACRTFSAAYQETSFGLDEHYVAPIFNALIARDNLVKMLRIETEDFEVFGTPSELESFCRQHNLRCPI
jgi:dTDP-glucose pyrophosphorylase